MVEGGTGRTRGRKLQRRHPRGNNRIFAERADHKAAVGLAPWGETRPGHPTTGNRRGIGAVRPRHGDGSLRDAIPSFAAPRRDWWPLCRTLRSLQPPPHPVRSPWMTVSSSKIRTQITWPGADRRESQPSPWFPRLAQRRWQSGRRPFRRAPSCRPTRDARRAQP